MELINKIEASISELEARLKKQNEIIGMATANIEKINAEKTSVTNESLITNGAIQAFRTVLKELKENVKSEVVTEVAPEVLPKDKKGK